MRILHIDCGRKMGGGQWQVLRLMRGLRSRGYECVLATQTASPLGAMAHGDGFETQTLTLRLPAADIVHVHDAHSHSRAALTARAPVIVARRVAFPIQRNWLSRWKYGRAAHFIAVSRYVAGMLTAVGIAEEKISIVYDGVPLLPLSSRSGDVLEMVKSTTDKRQAKPPAPPLEISIDLEKELLHARMLVYSSEAEGLGSGALLGMSAGLPVIASRVGGLPEAIEHGVNGILTSNKRAEVDEYIRRLDSDPAEAARLGAHARRTIEERFTVERMVEETLAVYRKVLDA